jgi:hypothetical protein
MSEEEDKDCCPCCGRPYKLTRTRKKSEPKPTDEEWMASLKDLYPWADVPTELKRMEAWLSINPRRQKTKRFIINWLNKVEKPLSIQIQKPTINKVLPKVDEDHYRAWKTAEGYPPAIIPSLFKDDPAFIQKKYLATTKP